MTLLQQPPVKTTSIEYWTTLVDNDVASHLLSLYFTWENPTWQLIDQTLFVHDLQHTPSHRSLMAINLDMKRAYDRMGWLFLRQTL